MRAQLLLTEAYCLRCWSLTASDLARSPHGQAKTEQQNQAVMLGYKLNYLELKFHNDRNVL